MIVSDDISVVDHRSAVLSDCEKYRYELRRAWAPRSAIRDYSKLDVLWIQHNPSTADALKDDATIRRNIGFSRRLGFSGMVAANLFAFRATDSRELLVCDDPVGPENVDRLRVLIQNAPRIICAWGNLHPKLFDTADELVRQLRLRHDSRVWCFGRTKLGEPRHPVRLPYETKLVPFHRLETEVVQEVP